MTKKWDILKELLIKIIAESRRPDYIGHATTTEAWLIKLFPKATPELKMAAFAHDIERCWCTPLFPIQDEEYTKYKQRHAYHCADLVSAMMVALEFPMDTTKHVHHLISMHEVGGDTETDLLRDADSLSYFDNNLHGYYVKNGKEETQKKILFMYTRASDKAKDLIKTIKFRDDLRDLLNETLCLDIS